MSVPTMSVPTVREPDLNLPVPGDTDLAVYLDGPDHADTTLVLVHGWSTSAAAWNEQTSRLTTPDVRRVRYDQRGHGATPMGHHRIGMKLLAEDLARVIDAVAPYGRVVLAGHCLGGMVVTALAATRPDLFEDRISGVVLTSTCGRTAETPTGRRGHQLSRARGRLLFWAHRLATGVRTAVMFGCSVGLHSVPVPLASRYWRAVTRHDQSRTLGVLARAKVTVMVGEKDRVTPVCAARDLVRHIPGARLMIAPDGGHHLPRCWPTTVDEFLREPPRQRARTPIEPVAARVRY